jgi:hypothetical protein
MITRIKKAGVALLSVAALTGCDSLLDVHNPNNLVEESIRQEAAASAVVNGAHALTASSISQIWQPYLVASDEMYWIGSRDAWLALDQGFTANPENEFTDGAFPSVGQARWMADEAIEILTEHVAASPSAEMTELLARANLYSGIMYMTIGEMFDQFAFSDKTVDGQPTSDMLGVLNTAMSRFDAAIGSGGADTKLAAQALKARTMQSHAIRSGSGNVNAGATSLALTVLGAAGADWQYDFTYSSGTISNSIAGWVNDRKENQFDLSLVTVNASNDVTGIALMDPIDGIPDPALVKRISQFKGGSVGNSGGPYEPMTITSVRLMHLIAAEEALVGGDTGLFTEHINHIRVNLDGVTAFSGQISNDAMLQYTRRVNTVMMGLRLADMYRWGITDPKWEPLSDAIRTQARLPITTIELQANCYLNGQGC